MSRFKPGDRVAVVAQGDGDGIVLWASDGLVCVLTDISREVALYNDGGALRSSTAPLPAWLRAVVDREAAALRERAESVARRPREKTTDECDESAQEDPVASTVRGDDSRDRGQAVGRRCEPALERQCHRGPGRLDKACWDLGHDPDACKDEGCEP